MKIDEKEVLGKWKEYTLVNDHGMTVSVLNYGAIITQIIVPDRDGQPENVVLGYKNYRDYERSDNYLGAIIGRVAGRIQDAAFELGGECYQLGENDGGNHLHGGAGGFHQVLWDVTPFQMEETVGLKLTHHSVDGDGGYPGNVDVSVAYTLHNSNQLTLDYQASADQTTPIALTNHSYFNLSGNLKDTIHEHHVTMDSSEVVELDEQLIPTGKLMDSTGTMFDFRGGRLLGDGIESGFRQNQIVGNGYDHYFLFDHALENNVVIHEPTSGRRMTVTTNQPGMVMYTANNLKEGLDLREGSAKPHLGVCFETQASPASLHHEGVPDIIVKAGEVYRKQTVFGFDVK